MYLPFLAFFKIEVLEGEEGGLGIIKRLLEFKSLKFRLLPNFKNLSR